MKYKTRKQRNLSFKQIVKRKNVKTKKTNANVSYYLNKRIIHKNRRHTMRLVKKYNKKTRKIQSGGLTGIEEILLGLFIGGIIFIVILVVWCASGRNHGCFGLGELATLFVMGGYNNTATKTRPYYRKRGNILNKSMVRMISWFKQREALSMARSIYSLLQKNNEHYLEIFRLKKKLREMFTPDQINLLEDILRRQPYEDFKIRIEKFAQLIDGKLNPDMQEFLSTNIIFSAAIGNNNRVVAQALQQDIVGNGNKKSLSSKMLSRINPFKLSVKPLTKLFVSLNNNPNTISDVVDATDYNYIDARGYVHTDAHGSVDNDTDAHGSVDTDTDAQGSVDTDTDAQGSVDTDTDAHGTDSAIVYKLAEEIYISLDEQAEFIAGSANTPEEAEIIKGTLEESNNIMLNNIMLDTALVQA
jgi:hypothetical protein